MAKKKNSTKATIIQAIKYSLSGSAYFLSGYIVFFLCDKGLGWDLWWSKLAANVVGVSVNFVLTRYWAFNTTKRKQAYQEAPGKYILLTLTNFVIDYWIVRGLQAVGITPYLGQFGSAGFFWVWNYCWYKYWVYKPLRLTRRLARAPKKGVNHGQTRRHTSNQKATRTA